MRQLPTAPGPERIGTSIAARGVLVGGLGGGVTSSYSDARAQNKCLGIARAWCSACAHVVPADPTTVIFKATPRNQHVRSNCTVPHAVLRQTAFRQPDLAWQR